MPRLPEGQVVNSLFSINIENAGPGDISAAHVTFFIPNDWLESNEAHKWSIQVHRLDDELAAWVAFPAKPVREDEDGISYTAALPGLSFFAITGSSLLPQQTFRVTDLTITPESPTASDDIAISAQVTNTGPVQGVYPAALWINDAIEATQAIELRRGQTTRFTFTTTRPEGVYQVRVERLIEDLSVQALLAPTVATPGPEATTTPAATQTPSAVAPGPEVPITATLTPTSALTPTPTPEATPVSPPLAARPRII